MLLRICLFLLLLFLPYQSVSAFTDTQNHWASEYIEDLQGKGIVKGVSDEFFLPDSYVTRAEFLKMLVKAMFSSVPEVDVSVFEDVSVIAWYGKYAAFAKERGIVSGYDGGRYFRPAQNVSRVEAVKMAIISFEFDLPVYTDTDFVDLTEAWQVPYVERARLLEIVDGYDASYFGPGDLLTRAQATKIIYKLMRAPTQYDLDKIKKIDNEDLIIVDEDFVLRANLSKSKIILEWDLPEDYIEGSHSLMLLRSEYLKTPTFEVVREDPRDFFRLFQAGFTSYEDLDIAYYSTQYYYRLCMYKDGKCKKYSNVAWVKILGGE